MSQSDTPHIQFLYFADCPSHEMALARLRQVLQEEGAADNVEIIAVESEEQAQQWRFPGSPTILINGADIVSPPPDIPYTLTCRAYHLEDGRISPLPSAAMIRAALQQARGKTV
jgi:hypothetical protein